LLEAQVHIALYNDPDGSKVRSYCDEASFLLFPPDHAP
jgi:hypothetical protein